jgi:hypothetical protein
VPEGMSDQYQDACATSAAVASRSPKVTRSPSTASTSLATTFQPGASEKPT